MATHFLLSAKARSISLSEVFRIKDGMKVVTDRVATLFAVAVMFPWAARELLIKPFEEGKLTVEDIALLADIPARYAAVVLGPTWEDLHDIMVGEINGDA